MQSLAAYQEMVKSAISTMNIPLAPSGLYDPVRYIITLGGKRIRPCLVLMAASVAGGNPKDAIGAAMGIELFHNFSLLHDDLMDDAPLRRGQATVHEKWNADTAILSGDVMLVQAWQQVCNSPSEVLADVLKIFGKTAVEVCEGQQFDMDFESRTDVKKSEYLEMIRLKTAVLLGCSLWIGARIGGASTSECDALYHFGMELGISFQLQDDLLDTYGDPKKFGKTTGGDIIQDKKTFLLINALELAEG
ncbi:MAG: geranylgeranyl diphosphate synthase type II, partial [Limisphaerales bacterium]